MIGFLLLTIGALLALLSGVCMVAHEAFVQRDEAREVADWYRDQETTAA